MPRKPHDPLTYVPGPGTPAQRVINWLQDHPGEHTSVEICEALDLKLANFHTDLTRAVRARLIHREKRHARNFYSLGWAQAHCSADESGEPATDRATEDDFKAALYHDGELVITGAREVDGGVILTAQQTQTLARMVAGVR